MLYALLVKLLMPAYWWGRVKATGVESVPERGPLLVVANHDSQWDPIVVALALRKRRRLRFLARADLWKIRGLGPILYGLGQIPIERGAGDARALEEAIERLRDGEAVCVFPEGKLSRGEQLRARSGVGRLAAACPQAHIFLCEVDGATDYVRFPRRPRVSVRFVAPQGGDGTRDQDPGALAARLLAQIRERVPPAPAGRRAGRSQAGSTTRACRS